MKTTKKWGVALLAVAALVLGLVLAGCSNAAGNAAGAIDDALVGTWKGDSLGLTFSSDGKVTGSGLFGATSDVSYSTKNGYITTSKEYNGKVIEDKSKYVITGNQLTISNSGLNTLRSGTYTKQ
jgi:hypothetical protein